MDRVAIKNRQNKKAVTGISSRASLTTKKLAPQKRVAKIMNSVDIVFEFDY